MGEKKEQSIDAKTIEQLACLEINDLILQPPFHLASNVQWNDKGISLDGDIDVHSHPKKDKSNLIGKVPVQIKGTTTYKKLHKKYKIKHKVEKKDLEVYYKNGKGVLYFVVTINPTTYERQAYYRMLAPLDLKNCLAKLDANGKNSTTISFKKLENGHLEHVCTTVINTVKKQPPHYIEASEGKEFTNYSVNFVDIKKESFDLFEETAYIYGFSSDNIEIPLKAAKVSEFRGGTTETVRLKDEEININYQLSETVKKFKIVIEDTLTFELDKIKNDGKFHLGKLKTLGSYVKCLQLIAYYIENNKLPFQFFRLSGEIREMEKFQEIEEEIKSYEELMEICSQIGIDENYVFSDDEDLSSLFNIIIDVFKNKKYNLLNLQQGKLENVMVGNIQLSKYVQIKLIYVDNEFINLYSEEALAKLGGVLPKTDISETHGKGDQMPDDWEDYYYKVSIFFRQNIENMLGDANFNFEIVKTSFTERYHDIRAEVTINTSLDYITYYDKSRDEKYLKFALDLNQRYLEEFPNNDIAKVNTYLIKLKQHHELEEEEKATILDIQERAGRDNDQSLCFACEVLLQDKIRAQRIFSSLDGEEKERMMEFPIYHFYKNLK